MGVQALSIPRVNQPFIAGIAERIRAVIARQPGHTLEDFAETLDVATDAFRELINGRQAQIDETFLIDIVTALARELAVDPEWLLTGQYDTATHWHALLIGEDRTEDGARALRDFVDQRYRVLREDTLFPSLRLFAKLRRRRVSAAPARVR
jgi:plasmid maintenance system antidote protein VapI